MSSQPFDTYYMHLAYQCAYLRVNTVRIEANVISSFCFSHKLRRRGRVTCECTRPWLEHGSQLMFSRGPPQFKLSSSEFM